jgi:hypothetical protein
MDHQVAFEEHRPMMAERRVMMEERWIAIDERMMKNKQDKHDKKHMFMNPTRLDEKAEQYFEYM